MKGGSIFRSSFIFSKNRDAHPFSKPSQIWFPNFKFKQNGYQFLQNFHLHNRHHHFYHLLQHCYHHHHHHHHHHQYECHSIHRRNIFDIGLHEKGTLMANAQYDILSNHKTRERRFSHSYGSILYSKQKSPQGMSTNQRRQILKDMKINIDMSKFPKEKIRNFCIIAHIDHGKSTLADRLLQQTGTINGKEVKPQFLDKLQVERERGITVKAQTCAMFYEKDGETYLLNLIDTPGHVDFHYEVSKSMSACNAALILVDSGQGIQAQTLANYFLALDQDLYLIPVITKIDQQTAQVDATASEIVSTFGMEMKDIIMVSAKTGLNCDKIIPQIVKSAPLPPGDPQKPLKALIFDSWYDSFYGVICLIYVLDGKIKQGDKIYICNSKKHYDVQNIGIMHPELEPTHGLFTGQVGFVILGMKSVKEALVGDTICHADKIVEPLPGFKSPKPMVFAGIYPVEQEEFPRLRDAIDKLLLNDSSVTKAPEQSIALGSGFRCGFLGLLHMDVFQQRLQHEFGTDVIITPPTNIFKLETKDEGKTILIENPNDFPNNPSTDYLIYEPMVKASIIAPSSHLQAITELCMSKRGQQVSVEFSDTRMFLTYKLPMNEIIHEFFDNLKSISHGYATLEYEACGYEESDLVKVTILINQNPVDAMSFIVHRSKAYEKGKEICKKLKEVISRQLFEVKIQAALGESKIIASERLQAFRKDVTAKCYGGDFSRKRKLLEKQKEGKKRMKQVGEVHIPHDAFISVFSNK